MKSIMKVLSGYIPEDAREIWMRNPDEKDMSMPDWVKSTVTMFCQLLRERRERLGMRRTHLGQKAGISTFRLWLIETGRVDIMLREYCQIATALNQSPLNLWQEAWKERAERIAEKVSDKRTRFYYDGCGHYDRVEE